MHEPPRDPDADQTQPIEYQRYGPAREQPRPVAWQAAPTWGEQQATTTVAERRRGVGLVPLVLLVLLTGIVSGGLSAFAVWNLLRPAAAADAAAADGVDANTASTVQINESSAVISATEAVGPAVVSITSAADAGLFGIGETGIGSGFIFDSNGWIMTNRHVVEGSQQLLVTLQDGREFAAEIYGVDTLTDLAIIKVEAGDLPAAPLGNSAELQVGQLAIAIGTPLGNFANTVTTGVISGLGRQIVAGDVEGTSPAEQLNNLIQTDAAINPGNSGGPLVNSGGQVIGVNTAVARAAQGIGFAIPIDLAKPIMEQALNGEELARPWIGIYYSEVTPELSEELELSVDYGVIVERPLEDRPAVFPDSPAEQAGIQEGDVIVALDDTRIDQDHQLQQLVLSHRPGDTITLRIVRGSSERELEVTLGVLPDDP
jgi:serine protease Do